VIFDEAKCRQLYLDYTEHGDTTALTELIAESEGLINVFAVKYGERDPVLIDELKQVGTIKIYDLVRNRKYNPNNGKLHSLLSSALPNAMVDTLRRQQKQWIEPVAEFEEVLLERGYHTMGNADIYRNGDTPDEVAEFRRRTASYAVRRFRSLHYNVSRAAAERVLAALTSTNQPISAERSNVTRALTARYKLTLVQSPTFYASVRAYLACQLAHQTMFEAEALRVVNAANEWTLRPEVCLLAGPQVYAQLTYFFRRASVKF
jgi:hypothetical protein